jgi:hypothetical protein
MERPNRETLNQAMTKDSWPLPNRAHQSRAAGSFFGPMSAVH